MKKYLIAFLCIIFLAAPSISLNRQNQEHQHKNENRKHYEDREKRYEDRWYWQMPLRVMEELGIGPGMSVADVGAGIGYFTLKLAKKVGEADKVYASDIDGSALSFLEERRKKAGLDNIIIIHGKDDDPMLPESSVDLVLIVNTIQFVKEKTVFFNNISNSLKEDGKLIFIQWDAEKMDSEMPRWDSKDRERYTVRTMLKMIYDAGYEVLEIKDFLPMQLIYICQPSNASGLK